VLRNINRFEAFAALNRRRLAVNVRGKNEH